MITWALALLLTSCADAAPGPIRPAPVPSDLSSLIFPLDQYRHEDERSGLVDQAWNTVAVRCLQRFGFAVVAGARNARLAYSVEVLFGVVDEAEARRQGYTMPVGSTAEREAPLQARVPPEAVAVFDGTGARDYRGMPIPVGGCAGEANNELFRGVNLPFIDELESIATRRLHADAGYLASLADWQKCMRNAGYQYDHPTQPIQTWLQRRRPGASASTQEISAAVVDVGCKEDTGALRRWAGLALAHQRRVVEENATALADYREAMTALADRAKLTVGTIR